MKSPTYLIQKNKLLTDNIGIAEEVYSLKNFINKSSITVIKELNEIQQLSDCHQLSEEQQRNKFFQLMTSICDEIFDSRFTENERHDYLARKFSSDMANPLKTTRTQIIQEAVEEHKKSEEYIIKFQSVVQEALAIKMEEVFLEKQMEQAKLEEEEEQQEAIAALRGVKQNIRAKKAMTQRDLLTYKNTQQYNTHGGAHSPQYIIKNGEKVIVVDENAIKEKTVSTFVERDSQIVQQQLRNKQSSVYVRQSVESLIEVASEQADRDHKIDLERLNNLKEEMEQKLEEKLRILDEQIKKNHVNSLLNRINTLENTMENHLPPQHQKFGKDVLPPESQIIAGQYSSVQDEFQLDLNHKSNQMEQRQPMVESKLKQLGSNRETSRSRRILATKIKEINQQNKLQQEKQEFQDASVKVTTMNKQVTVQNVDANNDNDTVPQGKLNAQQMNYYQSKIKSTNLFNGEHQPVMQAGVTELPHIVDLLYVYKEKIFVGSAEKVISVFNTADFKKEAQEIETSEAIQCLAFCEEKVYVGQKNQKVEIFNYQELTLINQITVNDSVTQILAIPNVGIVIGQDNGFIDVINAQSGKFLLHEKHPYGEKINYMEKSSDVKQCELVIVTAGQVFFSKINMEESLDENTLIKASSISFDLDEMYLEDGSQVIKAHEYEPKKFICLTWWSNKIFLFTRSRQQESNNVITIQPAFGQNLQCVGLYKIPNTKSYFLLKLRDGLILLDIVSQQIFKLNQKKLSCGMSANMIRVLPPPQVVENPTAAPASPAGKKETILHEYITIENQGGVAGIESPFVSNKKTMVKYQISAEMVEAMRNVVQEAIQRRRR